jgi:hypothetical protein
VRAILMDSDARGSACSEGGSVASAGELLDAANASRRIRTKAEVAVFEQALAGLARQAAAEPDQHGVVLPGLLLLFDDDCVHFEVMWGLVHMVEDGRLFELDDYLVALIKVLPQLLSQAQEWALLLHYRILNGDQARDRYRELVRDATPSERAVVCQTLQRIATQESGTLAERAQLMLSVC